MDFKAPKHNTPAATLLKNYQDKKSGKVTESRHEIFSMIAKVCKGEYQSSKMYKWDIDYSGSSELSILSNRVVRHTLFDIEYYLDRESLADQIRSWNSEVMAEVRDGDEYRMIAQMRSNEPGFQQEYLSLMKKYYLRHLNLSGIETTDAPHESLPCPINGPGNDTTAPNAILQEMRSQNPVVETLLKSFALELSEAVPF